MKPQFFEVKRDDMAVEDLVKQLDDQGVRMLPVGPSRIRAVTNYHITSDDVDFVLARFSQILKK